MILELISKSCDEYPTFRKYYICMIEKEVKKGNNKNGLISFILSLHPQIKLSIPNTSTD